MKERMFKYTLILALLLGVSLGSQALPITEIGSLTSANGGIVTGGGWTSALVTLGWNITYDSNTGNYTYVYTFNTDTSPGLSHLILEVSSNFTSNEVVSSNPSTETGDPVTYGPAPSNPGIPGSLFGLKFNTSGDNSATITLVTPRAPMDGSFYTKAGGGPTTSYAYSSGFAGGNDFVRVPDTVTNPSVPEPSSLLLLGLGGLGLVGYSVRRRRA